MNSLSSLVVIMNSFIVSLGDNGNYTSKQLLNKNMTMLLSSDKLVIMKIVTCALVMYYFTRAMHS